MAHFIKTLCFALCPLAALATLVGFAAHADDAEAASLNLLIWISFGAIAVLYGILAYAWFSYRNPDQDPGAAQEGADLITPRLSPQHGAVGELESDNT